MKIDGYIIDYGRYGSGTTYVPATIVEVGKSTFKVKTDKGDIRVFNLHKDYSNSTRHTPVWLQPAKGQRLDERGKSERFTSAPSFDMDVEAIRAQADKAIAALALRNRYRAAHKAITEKLAKHGTDGSRAPETLVTLLESMARLIPVEPAPVSAAVQASTDAGIEALQMPDNDPAVAAAATLKPSALKEAAENAEALNAEIEVRNCLTCYSQ